MSSHATCGCALQCAPPSSHACLRLLEPMCKVTSLQELPLHLNEQNLLWAFSGVVVQRSYMPQTKHECCVCQPSHEVELRAITWICDVARPHWPFISFSQRKTSNQPSQRRYTDNVITCYMWLCSAMRHTIFTCMLEPISTISGDVFKEAICLKPSINAASANRAKK